MSPRRVGTRDRTRGLSEATYRRILARQSVEGGLVDRLEAECGVERQGGRFSAAVWTSTSSTRFDRAWRRISPTRKRPYPFRRCSGATSRLMRPIRDRPSSRSNQHMSQVEARASSAPSDLARRRALGDGEVAQCQALPPVRRSSVVLELQLRLPANQGTAGIAQLGLRRGPPRGVPSSRPARSRPPRDRDGRRYDRRGRPIPRCRRRDPSRRG